MTRKLEGKVAVVTGAGGRPGTGRAVAMELASEGAKVVVNDIGQDIEGGKAADRVAREITDNKGIAVANYDSVASWAGGENIIKTAIDNFGRIDILVNCAGNAQWTPTIDLTTKEWESILGVHITGTVACSKAAMPYMIKQKSGRIINFSSRGAFDGSPKAAYATAKAGIMGFTSAMSEALRQYNITVNAILPSVVSGMFSSDLTTRHGTDNIPRSSPKAGGEFVAPVVAYLATDEAKDVTGRFIYSSAGDVCLYIHPFRLSAGHVFLRKTGRWSVDELGELIPPLLGLS